MVRASDLKSVGRGFKSRSALVLKSPDGEWPIKYTSTSNCFPFDVIVFATLPANGI